MPKIKFENGVTVNVEGNPTPQDIEEIASKVGVSKPAETPGGVVGALKSGWSGLKESLNKRVDNTGAAMNTKQSVASKALQVAGQGFGTIGDVIGTGITTAASAATPDSIEQPIKNTFTEGVKKIMGTETAQNAVKTYDQFKTEHPELAGNLGAVANIADALLMATGVGEVGKGAEQVVKQSLKTGAKVAAETGEKIAVGAEKAMDLSGQVSAMTKKLSAGAKEKFAGSKIGEKVGEIVSPIDNNVMKTIDPLSSVPKENIANISKETIDATKKATSDRMEFYINKARRAMQNPSLPTPLEFAGKKAEEALGAIGDKLSKYGELKKAETAKVADTVINGVQDLRTKLMDSVGERVGVEFKDGEFVPKAGRSIAVSDPADLGLIKTIDDKLASLGENPSFKQVDDAVDYLQDMLYKKKSNLAVPINGKIEGIVKNITGELNSKLRSVGGDLYKKSNQRLSGMMDARDLLNKALGRDANKGGSLMKRVFSPTDGGTKELFNTIKKITGIDLNEEATLAKFAMENAGDARQANLLEQLELLKGAVGAKGSFLTEAVKNIAQRVGKSAIGTPVDRARRILQK